MAQFLIILHLKVKLDNLNFTNFTSDIHETMEQFRGTEKTYQAR